MQDFNSFIQSLLSNPSPQGGMMGGGGNQPNRNFYDQAGNDAYYQNPYRMQDSIDAAMLKRKEADAATAAAMGQQMPVIDGGGSDGYNGDNTGFAPSAPTIGSMNAQDTAFAALQATQGLTPGIAATMGPLGLLGLGGQALANSYLDNQIDAMSNQYGATPSGMFSVSDQNGNVSTVSNDASIAAQNMAEFGVTGMDTGSYNAGNVPTVSNDASIAAQNMAEFGVTGMDDGMDYGTGGGGGGGKIICTAMNQAYGFGSFRNAIWVAYADKHLTKAHEVGYHTLFLPLVDFGFKQGDGKANIAVRKVLEWGTRHRSTDLRAELRHTKRDTTGRIIRFIFEPLCYAVGKLKGY
jgi:hypothetical protein